MVGSLDREERAFGRSSIGALGELWLEARCGCGCALSILAATWNTRACRTSLISDWVTELACTHCGGAAPEILTWNGVIDTGYGSDRPERTVLLRSGQGA